MSAQTNDRELALEQESLAIVGSYVRDCVGQSNSVELKASVKRLTDRELGTLCLFVQYLNTVALSIPEPPIVTDQLSFFN